MWYFIIGLIWSIGTLVYVNKQRKSVREYWFTVLFFGTLLWPIFMYFAFEKGFVGQFCRELTNWVRGKSAQIYR